MGRTARWYRGSVLTRTGKSISPLTPVEGPSRDAMNDARQATAVDSDFVKPDIDRP